MKISVIVPIYNMEDRILHAVDCLKAQDYPNLEFIMINDGSTDGTLALLERAVAGDGRFIVISGENKGYGYTCNHGIEKSSGDYVAIYEPDDTLTPDFYSELAKAAAAYPVADIIRYNGFYRVCNGVASKLYTWEAHYTNQILDKHQMKRFWRSHPSVYNGLYRKDFLQTKKIRFCPTPGASFQDAPFMVSLYYSNPSIYVINKSKYYYNIHDNQSINNVHLKIDNIIENWKMEKQWMDTIGVREDSFFFYRVCMQVWSVCKKIKEIPPKKRLLQGVKSFELQTRRCCNIATVRQRIICQFIRMLLPIV